MPYRPAPAGRQTRRADSHPFSGGVPPSAALMSSGRKHEGRTMIKRASFLTICVALFATVAVQAQSQSSRVISSGTEIHVRTDQAINLKAGQNQGEQIYPGSVTADVVDQSGNVAIPRGSRAE